MTDTQTITTEDVASAGELGEEVNEDAYRLVFKVLPPNGEWIADGQRFAADADGAPGGKHRIETPDEALVRAAGSAHDAGVIEVSKGLDVSHIESQEDSEAKLAEAMGEWVEPTTREDGTTEPGYWTGPWVEGHLLAVGEPGKADIHVDVTEEEQP